MSFKKFVYKYVIDKCKVQDLYIFTNILLLQKWQLGYESWIWNLVNEWAFVLDVCVPALWFCFARLPLSSSVNLIPSLADSLSMSVFVPSFVFGTECICIYLHDCLFARIFMDILFLYELFCSFCSSHSRVKLTLGHCTIACFAPRQLQALSIPDFFTVMIFVMLREPTIPTKSP